MPDPTPEENERIDQTLVALALCKQHYVDHGRTTGLQVAGSCPRCGDKLKYLPAYNGHFTVWCDTTGCLEGRE